MLQKCIEGRVLLRRTVRAQRKGMARLQREVGVKREVLFHLRRHGTKHPFAPSRAEIQNSFGAKKFNHVLCERGLEVRTLFHPGIHRLPHGPRAHVASRLL